MDQTYSITDLQFTVLSPDEIRRIAVCDVYEPMLYERGLPRNNSVLDLRLGTTDRRFRCSTCKNTVTQCNGHFGKIELATCVFNPVLIDVVHKILRSVCYWCAHLLLDPADAVFKPSRNQKKRLAAIATRSARRTCPCCHGPQPSWMRTGMILKKDFSSCPDATFEDEDELSFAVSVSSNTDVYSVLDNISAKHSEMLGLGHTKPSSLMFTVLLCPPVIMRPSVASSESSKTRGHDDLTLKLQDIVKSNLHLHTLLRSNEPVAHILLERAKELLQMNIVMYLTNDVRLQNTKSQSSAALRRSASMRSITTRLRGKKGRIRGNLCGKRVDYSSRSVVGPDPLIDIDELGVPGCIATKQTLRCHVFDANTDYLRGCVRIGAGKLGGAHSIECADGTLIHLLSLTDEQRGKVADDLSTGDVVQRHLKDGDLVIFNRQPSLHMHSMMAHTIRILPGETFRLNPQSTGPYNADFDGDEMNMHCPQRIDATAEMSTLMHVSSNLISPQHSNSAFSLIQDVVVGLYRMSDPVRHVTRDEAMQHVAQLRYVDLERMGPIFGSVGESVSCVDLLHSVIPKSLSCESADIKIIDGRLLRGRLTKSALTYIIATIARELSGKEATMFMSDAQRLAVSFLYIEGFTCSMADCNSTKSGEAQRKIVEMLSKTTLITESDTAMMVQEAMNAAGSIAISGLRANNNLQEMIACGSKGSIINTLQIAACVGQQTVGGRRIVHGTDRRTLPSFLDEDMHDTLMNCQARGFVMNSYRKGLSAEEYFFHMAGGREGLVDTAVKTAHTGYMTRRVGKFLENQKATQTGSVINSCGDIVQQLYGGDGFAADKLEPVKVHGVLATDIEWGNGPIAALGCAVAKRIRRAKGVFERVPSSILYLPCNITRYLLTDTGPKASLDLCSAVKELSAMHDPICVHLCWELCKASDTDVVNAIAFAKRATEYARVPAGYSPGIVAAQSLGQPVTQMTLNTFHMAGRGSELVSAGVPRLGELLDQTKKIALPMMRIAMTSDVASSRSMTTEISKTIVLMTLEDLRTSQIGVNVISDPDVGPYELRSYQFQIALDDSLLRDRNTNLLSVANLMNEKLRLDKLDEHTHAALFAYSAEICGVCLYVSNYEALIAVSDMLTINRNTTDVPKMLVKVKEALLDLPLTGFCGVKQSFLREHHEWSEKTQSEQSVFGIETMGINLAALTLLPHVDMTQTVCTNTQTIYQMYGIEATMNMLYRDFVEVLGEGNVHARHIWTMLEAMAFDGVPNSINRHGLARTRATPLHRASFEETVDTLTNASIFNASCCVRGGITEEIMNGTSATIGTGSVHLVCNDLEFIGRTIQHTTLPGTPPGSHTTPPGTPPGTPATPPGTPPGTPRGNSPATPLATHPPQPPDSPPFHPMSLDFEDTGCQKKRSPGIDLLQQSKRHKPFVIEEWGCDVWDYEPKSPIIVHEYVPRSP